MYQIGRRLVGRVGGVGQVRFGSNKAYDPFARSPRAPAETPPESGDQLWTKKYTGDSKAQSNAHSKEVSNEDADDIFAHPLKTPPAKPYVGVGPMLGPMKWPEFDQRGLLASRNPRVASPPGPDNSLAYFEDPLEAPIGAYPRITHQFTELKDPYKYWDQQGRRNYGDILADQELQMNQWSHGPGVHRGQFVRAILVVLGVFYGLYAAIDAWDPSQHLWQAERDYPYNGLHLELGADPNNLDDTAVTARQYKDQFTGSYKSI